MSLAGRHIALVGPLPPPSGGMANQTLALEQLLQAAGAQVALVRVNAPYRPAWVANIKGLRALFRLAFYLLELWRTAGRAELFHLMANSGWSWHLFAAPAVWIAWLRRKPVVLNYRGGHAESFFAKSWPLIRPTLAKCRLILVPSAFLQEIFQRRGFAAVVVPNILDLERFQALAARSEEGSEARLQPHLVVTRNLEAIYDVATALRAFALIRHELPGATLTVAGSGPEAAALARLAAELDLSSAVRFTGRLSNQEVAELYRQADLMLNASIVDNSPNSILEALASDVPVVSTNVGGIPYLVRHEESALLVEPRQPEALAQAAVRVLRDEALRVRLIAAGRQLIRRYDKGAVGQQLSEHYLGVLNLQASSDQ